MAKKKSQEAPAKVVAKPKKTTCFRCDGSGLLCNGCMESESVCDSFCGDEADEPAGHSDCPDCKGTGK